jgi:hypothetical protein
MFSFVAFGTQHISLAERSRSSFALVVFILCAGEDLPSSRDTDQGCPYWDSQV